MRAIEFVKKIPQKNAGNEGAGKADARKDRGCIASDLFCC